MHYFFDENLTRAERVNKQEEEIFSIIQSHITTKKRPPTIREIANKAQVSSTQTVSNYLARLKGKGLIDWEPKRPGTLQILDKAAQ